MSKSQYLVVNMPLDAQVQQSSEVQITKNYSYVFLWDGKQCTVNGITFVAARTIITWALSELKMQAESPDSFYFCVAGSNDRWTGNRIVPWEGFGGAQLLLHRALPAAGEFRMESSHLARSPQLRSSPAATRVATQQETCSVIVSFKTMNDHRHPFSKSSDTAVTSILEEYLRVGLELLFHRIADLPQ